MQIKYLQKKCIQNWKEIQNLYKQILQNKTATQGKPIFLLQTNYWRGRKKLRFRSKTQPLFLRKT